MNETILLQAVLCRDYSGSKRHRCYLKADAKLYRLGDQSPYFSLIHDRLLEQWPELKPLADIHLSDENGVPMHAIDNGYYWAGGNREWCKGKENDPPNPFYLASHLRISLEEAHRLIEQVASSLMRLGDWKAGQAEFANYVEAQKPRWAKEAEAAKELIRKLAKPAPERKETV